MWFFVTKQQLTDRLAEAVCIAMKRQRDYYSEGWDDGFRAGKAWIGSGGGGIGQVSHEDFDPDRARRPLYPPSEESMKGRDMKKMSFPDD